jgi:arabinoxylan arabinofuranohydrolase
MKTNIAFAFIFSSIVPFLRADNPIVPNVGLTDPFISIVGDRAYLYASHDASPQNKTYVMNDW